MRFLVAVATASLVFACGPKSTELPLPTDTADLAGAACNNLRSPAVNCPEGFGSVGGISCKEVLVNAHKLRPLPLECWAKAASAAEARGCGSLRCIR